MERPSAPSRQVKEAKSLCNGTRPLLISKQAIGVGKTTYHRCRRGKSLLPASVVRVDGAFGRGDAVIIRGLDGAEVGHGLVAYDAEDAAKIIRNSSSDIVFILGVADRQLS